MFTRLGKKPFDFEPSGAGGVKHQRKAVAETAEEVGSVAQGPK